MQTLYQFEAMDVRRADVPGGSRALTVNKVSLPALKRLQADHSPGGGAGKLRVTFPQIEQVEPSFEVKGMDREALRLFGLPLHEQDKWVFAGAMRDKTTSRVLPVRANIQGVMTEIDPDDFGLGDHIGMKLAIKEVVHYELVIDGIEEFYFDFFEIEVRVGGVSVMSPVRNALGGS